MNIAEQCESSWTCRTMKNILAFGVIVFLSFSLFDSAYSTESQLLEIKVDGVIDGDTFHFKMNELPGSLSRLSVRVYGIDTPEKGHRAKCEREAALSERAKKITEDLVKSSRVFISDYRWDKFGGRVLAKVTLKPFVETDENKNSEVDLASVLISQGVAVPYYGKGEKFDWCENPKEFIQKNNIRTI